MKFFANLKKLNKLGASMVEYAIVLACIASLGVSVSDNLTNVLNKPFNSIASILGLASNQQSAKDIASDLFTNKLYGASSKDEIFGKLIGHIWSGSRQSISLGAELCAAGIDTLFAVDDLVPGMSNYNALVSQELMPENAKYAKLVTIADKNGLDSSANGFSATQYLCYQKDGKLVLAATRKIDSLNVTELKAAQTVTASNGNEYTINKSINSASFIGTDDKTYKTGQINNDFIRYEPK